MRRREVKKMAIARTVSMTDRSVTQTGNQVKSDKSVLGKDDFLKLLVTKLRYSSAMMDGKDSADTEFISQMAQFSNLEQMQNLGATMTEILQVSSLNQAASLLGKTVEARVPGSGETVIGQVSAVEFDGRTSVLVVGEIRVPLANVLRFA